jgi:hypothetical protein
VNALDCLRFELRRAACDEARVLTEVLVTLSPREQADYLLPLLCGAGVNLGGRVVAAAVRQVAAEKAADLIMGGYHVEALQIAATLGDRELAGRALQIGLEAHTELDDEYRQRLLEIADETR